MLQQEIELKYRIPTETDFNRLLQSLGTPRCQEEQINFFFDTVDFRLKNKGLCLRLRQSNEVFFLTCKAPVQGLQSPNQQVSMHDEWEVSIDPPLAQSLLSGSPSCLEMMRSTDRDWSPILAQTRLCLLARLEKQLENRSIQQIGSFSNLRTHFSYEYEGHSLDFELDQTRFSEKQIDRELEIEIPALISLSGFQAHVEEFLRSLSIPIETSTGKSERFFALLRAEALI
ncbi:MAG: CYTH domain-containing protein [Myxococcaceae bacterium]|nr:CYTH domain-containing protein [Myxococcaceae bacterium]MBH2005995.1 CYTH domain-containing protein [Myxococcaceae bacterium]